MLPVIYSASSSEFSSNGQGVLIDCLSCRVTEERNGIFEMELTYPSNGQHADKLVVDAIIKATAHKGDEGQLFRIYKIDKNLDGDIVCHCQHISYQLSFIVCSPFTAANVGDAFTALANHMEDQTAGFTFATDKSTVANIKIDVPTTSRSVLGGMEGSILDVYHGEYEFNNFNVKLWNNRGRDNGVVLRYGKNITDINQESNIADTYTGLRPYYYDGDELVELTTSDKCVWCDNANSFPYKRVYILDCTSDFSDLTDEYGDRRAPTPAELLAYANSYISNHDFGVPKVTVKVEFEALWDNPEYVEIAMLETVNLCDTVHVEFEALNISVSSKVIKTVYDSLLDRYVSLTVGSATANFTDTVASMNEKTVEYVEDTANALELAQQRATDMLLGVNGGYKVEKRNGDGQIIETLYMDSLDESTATKVWRWNINGLGFSPNGPAGPYPLAITSNGEIVADFITTGTLNANLITAGVLKSQENANNPNFYANLATGDVTVAGTIKAAGGTIGRYTISSTSLYTGTGSTQAGMGGNQAFWAGNSSSNSAPFRVAYDGTLYASNATISGAITATSLTLGSGVTIPYSTGVSGKPDLTVYYQKGSTLGTVASGSNGFTVSTAGLLQASNAVIYGTIYAGNGTIGGWNIGTSSIYKSVTVSGTSYETSWAPPTSAVSTVFAVKKGNSYIYSVSSSGKVSISATDDSASNPYFTVSNSSSGTYGSYGAGYAAVENSTYRIQLSNGTVHTYGKSMSAGQYDSQLSDSGVTFYVYTAPSTMNTSVRLGATYSNPQLEMHARNSSYSQTASLTLKTASLGFFNASGANLTHVYADPLSNMVRLATSTSASYGSGTTIGVAMANQYRAFILICTRGVGKGAMGSTLIPLAMAKTSDVNSESWCVSAQNNQYQAKCYFDFTNNKIYVANNNGAADCRAEVWGLR